jgi:hypothetical protein
VRRDDRRGKQRASRADDARQRAATLRIDAAVHAPAGFRTALLARPPSPPLPLSADEPRSTARTVSVDAGATSVVHDRRARGAERGSHVGVVVGPGSEHDATAARISFDPTARNGQDTRSAGDTESAIASALLRRSWGTVDAAALPLENASTSTNTAGCAVQPEKTMLAPSHARLSYDAEDGGKGSSSAESLSSSVLLQPPTSSGGGAAAAAAAAAEGGASSGGTSANSAAGTSVRSKSELECRLSIINRRLARARERLESVRCLGESGGHAHAQVSENQH